MLLKYFKTLVLPRIKGYNHSQEVKSISRIVTLMIIVLLSSINQQWDDSFDTFIWWMSSKGIWQPCLYLKLCYHSITCVQLSRSKASSAVKVYLAVKKSTAFQKHFTLCFDFFSVCVISLKKKTDRNTTESWLWLD